MSQAIDLHRQLRGKFSIESTTSVTQQALALLYTPGVAEVSQAIAHNPGLSFELTRRWNLVAIVSDGTRVLGLGDIGPEAAMPVMEGKAIICKRFAGVDAVPLCIPKASADEIVRFVTQIAPSFGAINLEDIETPKVFAIEERLRSQLPIPVFHDDQYGTGTVVLAGLINAAKVIERDLNSLRVVIAGAGAAGQGVAKLLLAAGVRDIVLTDSRGALYAGRPHMDTYKQRIAAATNRAKRAGSLTDILVGADVFVGLSGQAELLTSKHVKDMHARPIVFALTNPQPEILPTEAFKGGAAVVATGRSDFANQINNSLVFPGALRGLLDSRSTSLHVSALVQAAQAIAALVEPAPDRIVPLTSDEDVSNAVAKAVRTAARSSL